MCTVQIAIEVTRKAVLRDIGQPTSGTGYKYVIHIHIFAEAEEIAHIFECSYIHKPEWPGLLQTYQRQ